MDFEGWVREVLTDEALADIAQKAATHDPEVFDTELRRAVTALLQKAWTERNYWGNHD